MLLHLPLKTLVVALGVLQRGLRLDKLVLRLLQLLRHGLQLAHVLCLLFVLCLKHLVLL